MDGVAKHYKLTLTLISILVFQIFTIMPPGNIGANILAYRDAFGQTTMPNQTAYTLYQNNTEGVSIEYPSNWTYSELTQGGRMVTAFYPYQGSATVVELFYDKTTNYVGTDQQKLDRLPQIINDVCSRATIAKLGFSCSNFQYKTSIGNYSGAPAYVMVSSMTEAFSDGSSRQQDMAQFLVIEQNSDYGILASCPQDQCQTYDNELNNFVKSLDIYSIKTQSNGNSYSPQQSTPVQATNYAIPVWIKNNAKWWSEGQLTDADFIQGIQYLIQQGIIAVPTTQVSSQSSQGIPAWVKNTAKWWAEGQVEDSDFIKSVQYLVQNGIISTQTAGQAQGAVTDQQGMATFQVGGQNVQFSFVDDTTGQPLSGADVVFALDPQTQSIGTLLVIDPTKHYPVQVIILTPSETSPTTPAAWQDYFIPTASAQSEPVVKIAVTTIAGKAGSLLPVSFLHNVQHLGHVVEKANFYYDALALVAKFADKQGWLPVSQYLQNHGYETGTISSDEAMDKIKEENNQGRVIDGLFLVGSGGASLPGFIYGRVVGETTANMDMDTVAGCPSQEVQYVQIGSTLLYTCNSNKESGLLRYNPPAETTNHTSLDILSQANQGFGERIQTEQGQPVPVPSDNYTVQVSTPGTTPETENVTVPPDQITDVTTAPQPIPNNGMTTVITPARDLSGNWSGSFSMQDTSSDGCSFSGSWQATLAQNDNDLSGSFSIIGASSPNYPANDYCTLDPGTFPFEGGTVSSSSFQFDTSGLGEFHVKGYFTSDLIHGNFNECYDGSCATGTFTGSRG